MWNESRRREDKRGAISDDVSYPATYRPSDRYNIMILYNFLDIFIIIIMLSTGEIGNRFSSTLVHIK